MSVIFGVQNLDGRAAEERQLAELSAATESYAPDGTQVKTCGAIGMSFQLWSTHERTSLESQPLIDGHGNMIAFDGRLDNYSELCRLLELPAETPDSQIISTAFLRWGENCFQRFVGDWAISLWSHRDRSLFLARDHAGTRTLYFETCDGRVRWSTYLETFLVGKASLSLSEGYIARYLSSLPLYDLTPFEGIRSVPPAHYVVLRGRTVTMKAHWNWTPGEEIRHPQDVDYEQHFLTLFKTSVERRTGAGRPILAQLSGGMDSTSIVCMSDHIRRNYARSTDLIDTVSFFDDSEPNWNERRYFSIVEEQRGKAGIHLPVRAGMMDLETELPAHRPSPFPGTDSTTLEREREFQSILDASGYRAILSGVGGDEVLGGVPNPLPELSDYLVTVRLGKLLKQSVSWALATQRPVAHILADVCRFSLNSLRPNPSISERSLPPWINNYAREICSAADSGEALRQSASHPMRPSALYKGAAWWAILETLPHTRPSTLTRLEFRYPYLDRDLVDFLTRIPREQLLRPGRRRSLMRSALRDIVPTEILERRRKAFIIHGPLAALRENRSVIEKLIRSSVLEASGFVTSAELLSALGVTTQRNDPRWCSGLQRFIAMELWFRASKNFATPATNTTISPVPVGA
jgi:asparagine synthase (glutamine-hydrolysing)